MTLDLFDLGPPQWDGDGRDPLDRYYTPEWATEELIKYLGSRLFGSVWEPCCGADMIGRAVREHGPVSHYLGTDVDPKATTIEMRRNDDGVWEMENFDFSPVDFLNDVHPGDLSLTSLDTYDWIVSNPPYTIPYKNGKATAADFVEQALMYRCRVAMLLRLTWLEPTLDREELFRENPPTDVLILRRVQYLNSGSQNMCTSAWVIWDPAREGQQTVRWAV